MRVPNDASHAVRDKSFAVAFPPSHAAEKRKPSIHAPLEFFSAEGADLLTFFIEPSVAWHACASGVFFGNKMDGNEDTKATKNTRTRSEEGLFRRWLPGASSSVGCPAAL